MSLYPSLEDMQVDHMVKKQLEMTGATLTASAAAPYPHPPAADSVYPTLQLAPSAPPLAPDAAPPSYDSADQQQLYPNLNEYMGLDLSQQLVAQYQESVSVPGSASGHGYQLTAPLSGAVVQKSAISHNIREVTLCKDKSGKVGLRCQAIDKGIFVVMVVKDSPAALAGLRFGDQILHVNGTCVAGYSFDKIHNLFRKSPTNAIKVAVRDRPFERSVTLHKDSAGCLGFQIDNGEIVNLIKDSSAARNGLLINHHVLELNGQNVVGLDNKAVQQLVQQLPLSALTVTIMPSPLYRAMMKKVDQGLIKKLMDHSDPDL